ncbi:metallophosphoesterase [Solemya velum gill symbiont]|uniref:metallophosphoesterase n=1 Tax=Solemya velum gill symbiont TaxID=2340 RepID=UPI0009977AE8|nr:metallophosphoesterase [Solemya velum gill symbiont]OOZ43295.1 hypothetical protein BOW37_11600 [Solemya velum gill symbiont]OOZ44289.1 hypothetical protein BOW38_11695 [Solemya velum gill symbiont]OOZ48060.1 hypothetical protein BOW39_12605 [Solemya velum gill symbiont]OOZ49541.1 hypothetical protein BOW40_11635 [Solemya velum gill symbiont]OOZ53080.1 hypothetical protein BOW41_11785 [Solemya velum gill symbiont]
MKQGYDLIGDIHRHANDLWALLEKMGYSQIDGCYRHETRKVIFLGDFIDRGIHQREVLNTVMAMVEHGTALAVMGNHEFNALAFHTEHPDKPGTWLRPRDNKNIKQHLSFLEAYLGTKKEAELQKVLDFFYTLPLWLELDGLRVVHACWEPKLIELIKPLLNPDNTLTPELLVEASTERSMPYEAVEALLKGVGYALPDGNHFYDKDGHKRHAVQFLCLSQECSSTP